MTDDEKKNVRMVNGCAWLLAELLISTGIGGFFGGWPVGFTIFGIALLIHAIQVKIKMRKLP